MSDKNRKAALGQEKSSKAPATAPPENNARPRARTCAEKVTLAICLFAFSVLLALSSRDIVARVDLALLFNPVHLWTGGTSRLSDEQHALKILAQNPLVDGHNDLAIAIRVKFENRIYDTAFKEPFENGGLLGHVDLKRIDKGEYAGAFWSAFWLCPNDIYDFSDKTYFPIVRATLGQIDLLHRLSAQYPSYFPSTPSASSASRNFHKLKTHIAPLAIEGLHQIGNSLSTLRLYHSLGVRYATLTWNCHNIYADAATLSFPNMTTVPGKPHWGGLSKRGRVLIKEMNRLGMIVDLAHVSDDTMRDVLVGEHNPDYPIRDDDDDGGNSGVDRAWRGALAPPIFSHSSVRALCPHPRNVPDDVLTLVKRRNSVVMINFNPGFISCHYPEGADPATELPVTDHEDATLEQVARHIMYVGEKIGYDYVGIGSDFDGIDVPPKGLEGVDKMPDLVAELLRKGVSEKDVVKVIGGNVLRVWEEVDRVSERLQKEGMLPAEDAVGAIGVEDLLTALDAEPGEA